MKKVIIIGAGIAGLSAGIYAQQAGFEAVIYEKHSISGGLCTGWDRQGYHIDGCIHWMTGTRPGPGLYEVWKNLGALQEDTRVFYDNIFGTYVFPEGTVTVDKDIQKFKSELLALAPEDAPEIKNFIRDIIVLQDFEMPTDMPMDMMSLPQMMQLVKSMKNAGKVMARAGKISCEEYGKKFKHPALQKMFAACMPEGFALSSFLFSLGTFFAANGGFPQYGSRAMAARMEQRFLALGGKLQTSCGVQEICLENGVATQVRLEDGSIVAADYIISACDPSVLFGKLLKNQLVDKQLDLRYKNPQDYPVSTSVLCSFAVAADVSSVPSAMTFETPPYTCGGKTIHGIGVKSYAFEASFAPQGHTVIECNIMLHGTEYPYWAKLAQDRQAYKQEKNRIAQEVATRLVACLPQLEGKLTLLDVATPATFTRYTGAYNGAWMGFIITPRSKNLQHKGGVAGAKNLLLAGQWTQSAGGLPVAAVSGKHAVQRICKKEKMNYHF